MYDTPTPEELLAAVARFLRDEAGPALGRSGTQPDNSALAYQARVAANMLDMVRRQGLLRPAAEAGERSRLQALLGETGGDGGLADPADLAAGADLAEEAGLADLACLNQRLSDRLAEGTLGLATPGLADHLWRTTLDKLAVDQPGYAPYQRQTAAAELAATAASPARDP